MAEVKDGAAPVVPAKALEKDDAFPVVEEVVAVEEESTVPDSADHKRKHEEACKDEVKVMEDGGVNGVEDKVEVEGDDAKRQRMETQVDVSGEVLKQEGDGKQEVSIKENGTVVPGVKHEKTTLAEESDQHVALVSEQGEAPAMSEQGEAPVESEQAETTAKSEQGEAPAKSEQGEAPAESEQGEAPAKSEQGDVLANTEHPEAPANFVQGEATANSEHGEAPSNFVHGEAPSAIQQTAVDTPPVTKRIDVPNNKVGVLIGKAGDTIRFLQYNSGAKIQITRDAESDPHSTYRIVELIGKEDCVKKAEQLIKDVIAEAEAGGSPALVARGFGTAQSGAEQLEIQVPNEKVGLIIGKGGDTIKSLQTKSGARIQLIPQHLPEGDQSKVRTVRISGNKKHVETATEMIQEVMSQQSGRSFRSGGGYQQQACRPRGPAPQWGPRAMHPSQASGYDYQHNRGMYPSQTQNYPPYGGYQQPPPRGGYGASWDQRPSAHAPTPPGGYDYQSSGHPQAPAGGPTASQGGYYGQPQGPGYGQSAPYAPPAQQAYGHGYNEPKYDGQGQNQQMYGQPPLGAQPGPYTQGGASQYQQPYNRPPYGGSVPSQTPQSYGQPRPSQPGEQMYQTPPNYAQGGQVQQQYPYGSQTVPAYNQQYGGGATTTDGYIQQPSGYAQPGGHAAGYAQAGQMATTYPQAAQSGGYGQYQQPQPNYTEQPPNNTPGYGYQGAPTDPATPSSAAYGVAAVAAVPAAGQVGYVQPPANASGYPDPSVQQPQAAYGSYPSNAPGSFA